MAIRYFWDDYPKIARFTFLGLGIFALVGGITVYAIHYSILDFIDKLSMTMLFTLGIGMIVCSVSSFKNKENANV